MTRNRFRSIQSNAGAYARFLIPSHWVLAGYGRFSRVAIYVLGAFVVLILGFFLGRNSAPSVFNSPLREAGYQYIAPVLLCNPSMDQKSNENVLLSNKLDDYRITAPEKDISVYYMDLTSYSWAGINVDEKFAPASMMKVPTMVTILRYAESHPEILQKKIYYDGSFDDNTAEYFKPQQSIQPGHWYTVDELLTYTIGYSDNNAVRLLDTQTIDLHDLMNIYIDLGIKLPANSQDIISPETYSLFLRLIYNGTYLDRHMSEKAIALLLLSDFPEGIKSGVPAAIEVANKFGERQLTDPATLAIEDRELHDCGIVYAPKPYVLCIMTRGNDFQKLKTEIADISKIVYHAVIDAH